MITSAAQLRRYAYNILPKFRDADGIVDFDALTNAVAIRFDELEPDACQCSDEIELVPTQRVYDAIATLIHTFTKES